jgi:hypothetical protein
MPVFGRQFVNKETRVKYQSSRRTGESDIGLELQFSSITDNSKNASNKSYIVRS